jgi:uncharacterized membrane protein
MKIDIKARLRNKWFWCSFISLLVILFEQLGIALPFDLNAISGTLLSMAVLLGIVVDTSSDGISDKKEGLDPIKNKEDKEI